MWPVTSSFGCGKAKAVQCYILLLIWLLLFSLGWWSDKFKLFFNSLFICCGLFQKWIIWSVGLYWFLSKKNTAWTTLVEPEQVGFLSDDLSLLNSETTQRRNRKLKSKLLLHSTSTTSIETLAKQSFVPDASNSNNHGKRKKIALLPSVISRLCSPPESIKAADESNFI